MRALSALVIGMVLLGLAGCASPIGYRFEPYHPIGTSLPVEVAVKHKPQQYVRGTVYYRTTGQGSFQTASMSLRGDRLWAVLPTDGLKSRDSVEYYVDVTKEDKLYTIGSPGSPFVATFLNETQLVFSRLQDHVVASDDRHPVHIVLVTNRQPVDQPSVVYRMPGVPGDISAPMQPDRYGNFVVVIPPYSVRPGTWQYAIEVGFDGETARLPVAGYRSFFVAHASVSQTHTGKGHEKHETAGK